MTESNFQWEFSYATEMEYFKHAGVQLFPGISLVEIETIQDEIGFIFPTDFREFYQQGNGYSSGTDGNYFTIWRGARIVEEYNQDKEECFEFIPFADFLINSHCYGYVRGSEGVFRSYNLYDPIAKDFKEFLKLLISDWQKLY